MYPSIHLPQEVDMDPAGFVSAESRGEGRYAAPRPVYVPTASQVRSTYKRMEGLSI